MFPLYRRIIILTVLFGVSCSKTMTTTPLIDISPGVELSVRSSVGQPQVNGIVVLEISATSYVDLENLTLTLNVPPEVKAPDSQLVWNGNLKRGETIKVSVSLEVLKLPLSAPVKIELFDSANRFYQYWPEPTEIPTPNR